LKVLQEIGCVLPDVTVKYLKHCDCKHQYDKEYKAQPEQKLRHSDGMRTKINDALKDCQKDASDGMGYGPSYTLPQASNVQQGKESQQMNKASIICPLEGGHQKGHMTKCSIKLITFR